MKANTRFTSAIKEGAYNATDHSDDVNGNVSGATSKGKHVIKEMACDEETDFMSKGKGWDGECYELLQQKWKCTKHCRMIKIVKESLKLSISIQCTIN